MDVEIRGNSEGEDVDVNMVVETGLFTCML